MNGIAVSHPLLFKEWFTSPFYPSFGSPVSLNVGVSVNLRIGVVKQNGTLEESVWTNDLQSVDQWDLPNVDFYCPTPMVTEPPRNDEALVPAMLG